MGLNDVLGHEFLFVYRFWGFVYLLINYRSFLSIRNSNELKTILFLLNLSHLHSLQLTLCYTHSHYICHVSSLFTILQSFLSHLEAVFCSNAAISPTCWFLSFVIVYSILVVLFANLQCLIYIFQPLMTFQRFNFLPNKKECPSYPWTINGILSVVNYFYWFSVTVICIVLLLEYLTCEIGTLEIFWHNLRTRRGLHYLERFFFFFFFASTAL